MCLRDQDIIVREIVLDIAEREVVVHDEVRVVMVVRFRFFAECSEDSSNRLRHAVVDNTLPEVSVVLKMLL